MTTAHTATPHNPLSYSIVLETAVGYSGFGEQVVEDDPEVGDGLVARGLSVVNRSVLVSGEGYLWQREVSNDSVAPL